MKALSIFQTLQLNESLKNEGKFNPYIDILLKIADIWLLKKVNKQRMILMYGASNSGKSTFMNYIQKIFKGYDNREASDRFGMWIKYQDTKASLVVADEWEPKHLNERNINEFKRMGEGGGMMYETKGYDPFIAFKESYFLYSTNSLHPILYKKSEELEP